MIGSSAATGKSFTSFVIYFSIVIISYFCTDLIKISIAQTFKNLLSEKGTKFINSIISIILIVSGVILIIKGV